MNNSMGSHSLRVTGTKGTGGLKWLKWKGCTSEFSLDLQCGGLAGQYSVAAYLAGQYHKDVWCFLLHFWHLEDNLQLGDRLQQRQLKHRPLFVCDQPGWLTF